MKPGFIFIDRPVFSAVISLLIVIIGIIGLFCSSCRPVSADNASGGEGSASYPGANALTVSQAVAAPIEQELNGGTPGMRKYGGRLATIRAVSVPRLRLTYRQIELSAVEIQNRVKLAESRLPAEVGTGTVSVSAPVSKPADDHDGHQLHPKFDEIYLRISSH